jgi:hypothetical protein
MLSLASERSFSGGTILPGSSPSAGAMLGEGRDCEDLISAGTVAGLTGVKVAPCADFPV